LKNSLYLYSGFAIILTISLILDLRYLTRRSKPMSVRAAFNQSLVWVALAVVFGLLLVFIPVEGRIIAPEYFSAYIMEYSLSMDNIFVFVLILSYFKISSKYYPKVLFYGILMAIIFRLIFIGAGFVLIERFSWILYFFGAFLIYTGYNILFGGEGNQFDPGASRVYKFMKKRFSFTDEEGEGKMVIRKEGKRLYTKIFLVVFVIGTTDVVFALDSIPAAFGITQQMLAIVTSNVFAVIGLRAMFFMLMNAVNKFKYLQQGISFVLIFIGGKMLAQIFKVHISTGLSLSIIAAVLIGSVVLSVLIPSEKNKKKPSGSN
jgi:tellurite resistance protein TerC